MKFLADTREQKPWPAPAGYEMARVCLPFGDYSVEGCERRACVERKSLDDFVGSVFGDWGRFGARVAELGTLERACVVVEATEEDVRKRKYAPDLRSTRRLGKSAIWARKLDALEPGKVLAATAKIFAEFRVPVFLAGSPTRAASLAFSILKLWHDAQKEVSR